MMLLGSLFLLVVWELNHPSTKHPYFYWFISISALPAMGCVCLIRIIYVYQPALGRYSKVGLSHCWTFFGFPCVFISHSLPLTTTCLGFPIREPDPRKGLVDRE